MVFAYGELTAFGSAKPPYGGSAGATPTPPAATPHVAD